FMDEYRKQIHVLDEQHRIIVDPDHENEVDEVLPEGKKRHLRHLSRADLLGRFADHCEWLLANQIASPASSVQLFNTELWVKFCNDVQVWREKSKGRWGMGYNSKWMKSDDPGDPYGLQRFGGTKEEWAKKLQQSRNRFINVKACRFHPLISGV